MTKQVFRPKMKPLLIYLPSARIEQLDKVVEKKLVANRNEAIREAVRDYLEVMYKWLKH